MEKPALTDHEIHPLIAQRWSPRAFDSKLVETGKLAQLFEAARWASSCFNDQPWAFIIATKDDTVNYQKMLDCIVPGNVVWAQVAPVLGLIVAQKAFKHNGKPNAWGEYDAGQAAATLVLQATALNLVVHQMGGFDATKAIATFNIPETARPIAAIAIGYAGETSNLPADLQERENAPRDRYPSSSFVFTGGWGNSAPFV
ncbi:MULTISPECIES: nitroreductase family protein [Pseudanabaena]|uniref:Nitroreductase n=2 Tax=Pseudanabaena TaxID=1152 RepID=L8N198_9CYAN|nr:MULTISPECIES: nitroreductase family protein [Pseudanabaena]ELS32033.1 nitroreductase [Pseudanabaena biceps PCC 7429]MDG3495718.1 nitroreductase family protein [Pseudanabaena catenata USMAC16]